MLVPVPYFTIALFIPTYISLLQNLSGSQNQERLSLDMKLESAQKEIQYLKNKENELSVVNVSCS